MDSLKQIGTSAVQVTKELAPESLIKIELLFGDRVHVLEQEGERVKVRTDDMDAYEGYMDAADLVDVFAPTHRVSVISAPIYHTPNFKNPQEKPLYFNSQIKVVESKETSEGLMHKLEGSGWIFDVQIRDIAHNAPDFLAECLKFLGISYGYERRGGLIDCSTLVQAGCVAAGIECPYDVKSGRMEDLGEAVEHDSDLSSLRRGDLVFWTQEKGSHVAIMVDETNALHATTADPHHKTLIQPLAQIAIEQARDGNGPITKVRRFPDYKPSL
jgi:cell wall-associated NlpC family hydrolase